MTLEDSGKPLATSLDYSINDEECGVRKNIKTQQLIIFIVADPDFEVPNQCSLCEVPAPARRVAVRGLCELSMFDK